MFVIKRALGSASGYSYICESLCLFDKYFMFVWVYELEHKNVLKIFYSDTARPIVTVLLIYTCILISGASDKGQKWYIHVLSGL